MAREFEVVSFVDCPELLGAHWWNHAVARRVLTRRALIAAGLAGAAGLIVPLVLSVESEPSGTVTIQSLEAQRLQGWDVGDVGRPFSVPDTQVADIADSYEWRTSMNRLALDLAPPREFAPMYTPTLFQSLSADDPHSEALVMALRPMSNPSLVDAFARGRGLARALRGVTGVSVVADLEGPASVAFAAGMAEHFAPVFAFDNWPHPRGCVPSHLTLAAILYFRPVFVGTATIPNRPPVVVLDRNRLNAPRSQFDNRYIVRLSGLSLNGRRNLLYVHPGSSGQDLESDDLNSLFSTMTRDLEVITRAMAIGDLTPCPDSATTEPFPTTIAAEYRNAPAYCHVSSSPRAPAPSGLLTPEDLMPDSALDDFGTWSPTPRTTMFSYGSPSDFGITRTADNARGCDSGGGGGGHSGSYSRGYGFGG